jgi:hypothetical protein
MSSLEYKAYQKQYYKMNKEARSKYFQTRYHKNKNKYQEHNKEYYKLNKGYYRDYNKEYYQLHKDYWKNYQSVYLHGYKIIDYDTEISVMLNPILDFDDEILGKSKYKVIFQNISRKIIHPKPLKYNEILEFDGELSSDEEQEQEQEQNEEQEQEQERRGRARARPEIWICQ